MVSGDWVLFFFPEKKKTGYSVHIKMRDITHLSGKLHDWGGRGINLESFRSISHRTFSISHF